MLVVAYHRIDEILTPKNMPNTIARVYILVMNGCGVAGKV